MSTDTLHTKPGMTGESITQLHQRLVLLGFEIPADELQEDRYGPGTEAAVRTFQAASGLATVDGRVDAATARGLGLGAYPTSIAGIVSRPDGAPLADVAVQLYQHRAGGEKVLAQTRSGIDGKFAMPWPPGIRGGLKVRAEGSAERTVSWQTALTSDPIWVRLSVGGAYRGPTRFAVLAQALAPAAEAGAVHLLGGAGRAPELAAIGEAVRVPAPDVARYVLAHKLAAKTELDPRVCFALLAHSVTPEAQASLAAAAGTAGDAEALDDAHVDQLLDVVLWQRGEDLRAGLAAAVAHNLVDEAEVDVEAAAAQLHELRIAHLAAKPLTWSAPALASDEHTCCEDASDTSPPLRAGDAALGDVIATAVTEPAARRQVLEAFAAHGSHARLDAVVGGAAGLSPAQRSDLRFTLEAAALLGNHLPLVKHVRKLRADQRIAKAGDLARFDEADWAAALRETDPDAAHIDPLARTLARRLERRYPTAALAGRLAKDAGALPLARTAGVRQFLDGAPAFCMRHGRLDRFVQEHGAEALPEGEDRAQVVADLKTL